MTKKDYELIARNIAKHVTPDAKAVLGDLARSLAVEIRESHRAFNVARFLRACKVLEAA